MSRPLFLVALATLALLLQGAPASAQAGSTAPIHEAADPQAPAVTAENLLASERFWPYHVEVVKPFESLKPGTIGVLIRIETPRTARVDFGRDGLHVVPVASTNLLERANGVRLGKVHKTAPNFLLAVGPRLVDSSGPTLRRYLMEQAATHRSFLAVFADPSAESFGELARTLAPLAEQEGLLTILFPQGDHPDAEVREKLRSLKWTVPFVYNGLSETYRPSLLDSMLPMPAVVLQTAEGRLLLQSRWRPDLEPELIRALKGAGSGGASVANHAEAHEAPAR